MFAHSLRSSFAQKLHALVAVGQSLAKEEARRPLFRFAMRGGAGFGEEAAVLHGNRLIVCLDEVMGLADHQTEAECEGGRAWTLHG